MKEKNIKKRNLIISISSSVGALILTLGLVFGLVNFSPKIEEDFGEAYDVTTAQAPQNTSKFWGDPGTNMEWVYDEDQDDDIEVPADFDNTYTWEGSGTEADPWQIGSCYDLAALAWRIKNKTVADSSHVSGSCYYAGKYFKQTRNINVSEFWWTPIGTSGDRYFSGNYDGCGYTISGIFTPASDVNNYQGLFGYTMFYQNSGEIKNVGIINSFIQGNEYVGGIVGGYASNIYDCYNTGKISGNKYVGGITGHSYYNIEDCYNTGNVYSSNGIAGGISGSGGTIKRCYNSGEIKADFDNVGGIVGNSSNNIEECYNLGNIINGYGIIGGIVGTFTGTMKNCYNKGKIGTSIDGPTGGIVGNSQNSTITNCINYGDIGGQCNYSGGIVGDGEGFTTIINCFNLGEIATELPCDVYAEISGNGSTVQNCYGIKNYFDLEHDGVMLSNLATLAKDKNWLSLNSQTNGSLTWNKQYPWDFDNVWTFKTGHNNGFLVLKWIADTQPNDVTKYWGDAGTNNGKNFSNSYTWSGSGTEADPWLIQNEYDLAALSWRIYNNTVADPSHKDVYGACFYPQKYFKQTADIDVSDYWWTPIGGGSHRNSTQPWLAGFKFSGHYDGNGHTVSGIYTQAGGEHKSDNDGFDALDSNSYQGLFGYVSSTLVDASTIYPTSIKNVGIINSSIQGNLYVGGVVGYFNSTQGCVISGCFNTSVVKGDRYVGGIVGWGRSANIVNCYNTGDISGYNESIGGIAGEGGAVNCYNTGSVAGRNYVGGVAGSSAATNSFNTGSVKGASFVSGVGISARNSYYGGDCTLSSGGIKLNNLTQLAKTKAWFEPSSQTNGSATWDSAKPWDFTNIWKINIGYPVFTWQPDPTWIDFADISWSGEGSESSPYIIDTPEKLAGIAKLTNEGNDFSGKFFKQSADIKLGGYNWIPIGSDTKTFSGTFDGNNLKIYGLKIIATENYSHGLFGSVNNATIKNISLKGYISTTYSKCGGLVGSTLGGLNNILGCVVDVQINGQNRVGGIVGVSTNGELLIENCIFKGQVTIIEYRVGGIIGEVNCKTTIRNCRNDGNVKGLINNDIRYSGYSVSGCVGFVEAGETAQVTVDKFFSTGLIEGDGEVAGLIGATEGGGSINIQDCVLTNQFIIHSTGAVLVGNLCAPATIKNCSFIGSSDKKVDSYVSLNINVSMNVDSCYVVINSDKYYSEGDFTGFAVVPSLNNGLPIQKSLYWMAEMADEVDILELFAEQGFKKV